MGSSVKNDLVAFVRSRPHVHLLSMFVDARRSDSFDSQTQTMKWTEVLKENPKSVVLKFVKTGLIKEASVEDKLRLTLSVGELKELLKNNGLRVSGKKEALIKRLVLESNVDVSGLVSEIEAYVCSDIGQKIRTKYLALSEQEQKAAHGKAMDHLRKREYKEACSVLIAYEKKQVFPGLTSYNENALEELAYIFNHTPKILTGISKECLDISRIIAGMMSISCMWDRAWIPDGFAPQLGADPIHVANLLMEHSRFLSKLSYYRKNAPAIDFLTIDYAGGRGCCLACKELLGKIFSFEDIVELPYHKCTTEGGCGCYLNAREKKGGILGFQTELILDGIKER
jgi:hypothetical protein